MIFQGRRGRSALAGALVTLCLTPLVHAQAPSAGRGASPPGTARLNQVNAPPLVEKGIPVNPTDPVAIINNEVITRAMLADECFARKGEEILETLIARKLIDQAMKARNLEVTAAEVNAEIDQVGQRMAGIGRQAWLRTLEKERGISPIQYARDIIYPSLALRKLATPRVQVTPQDLKDAFEAQYGDKLQCRIIMVEKLQTAQEVWDKLRRNPGGFEALAKDVSVDLNTKSLGGLLPEPIARHSYPRTVADAAFRQLVDGDPNDKEESHKPKDGDISGPIQVTEGSWILIRRETVIPAQKKDAKDPNVQQHLRELVFEAKLKEKMGEIYNELTRTASITNVLTGFEKLANEEQHPENRVDRDVKLMGNPSANAPATTDAAAAGAAARKLPPPAAAPLDEIQRAEKLKQTAPTPAPAPRR